MRFDEYQKLTQATAAIYGKDKMLVIGALGLGGESGEVIDHIKKYYGHGHDLDKEELKKELGDVLWYIAYLASTLGLDLEDIATMNIEKLKKRYPEGFSKEASLKRSDLK